MFLKEKVKMKKKIFFEK